MITATNCEKCIFAKSTDNSSQCDFNIIESIKDTKKIEIKNNYNYIYNYVCRYGCSKNKAEELLKDFPDTDIMDYARKQSYIKYYLVINNLDNHRDIIDLAHDFYKLAIKPSAISILTRQNDLPSVIQQYQTILGDSMVWRLHNFFDPTIDFGVGLYTAMSTSKHIKLTNFLWTVGDDQLSYMIENKAIEQINYIVNVLQPDVGILKSKKTTDNISGLFLTKANYTGLTTNVSQLLNLALQKYVESNQINISYYDD